jgi:hypothetical protein
MGIIELAHPCADQRHVGSDTAMGQTELVAAIEAANAKGASAPTERTIEAELALATRS